MISCHLVSFWRKREGVEPTRDRLAAPPGFEVRTPHRRRFSPRKRLIATLHLGLRPEEVEPVLVGPAQIVAAQRHAVTIEELEDLDCDLAAILDLIAELRC